VSFVRFPKVGTILEGIEVQKCITQWTHTMVRDAIRDIISVARMGGDLPVDNESWAVAVNQYLMNHTKPSLRPVINATGVVLHTNLGRAPLAQVALDAINNVSRGGSTLEYDLETGKRGSRHVHAASLLVELTGAEDALVVNNCAAGLVLALQTLCTGKETLVSRGELVEIGGSFRVPEIMAASGTKLVEVGTTNRTHPDDYRNAITPNTAAIVKVHRSNFTIDGFVSEVDIPTLVPIAEEAGIPLIHDFGSGLMLDLREYGLTGELTAREAVQQNPTLVIMSGDKLLGGPQAGIILGKKDIIAKLKKHPMARALRVDKLTYSALEATLGLYRNPNKALLQIPALLMLTTDAETIRFRAETIAQQVSGVVEQSEATVGGGAFPTSKIPSWSVVLNGNAMELERRLRGGRIPVITRIIEDKVWLDIRGVLPTDDELLITLIREIYV